MLKRVMKKRWMVTMVEWGWLGMATSLITKLRSLFKGFRSNEKKIRKYCGITTDPTEREEEDKSKFPRLLNWQVLKSFETKAEAEDWANAQTDCEKELEKYDSGRGPTWYGYKFDY